MKKILKVPVDKRDEKWEDQFLTQLPGCCFRILQDHPIKGPDNMPYLPVQIVERGESAIKVLRWLREKGVGLVVNPASAAPDFVLTYGMIWNFFENGRFVEKNPEKFKPEEQFEFSSGQQVFAGIPSEAYLPPDMRNLFRLFLYDQGIKSPKVLMISQDNENFDLCFSAESLGNPPQDEWRGILEGFSWFFPLHYSLSIISENAIKDFPFVKL